VRRCSSTYVRPVSTIQFQQVVVAEGVIDLGVGQPNNAILPVDYIRRAAMVQFGESPEFLQYGAEWGDGHHRIALGDYLSEAYGTPVAPEQLFSTNGNSQALEMLCTVMTEPGDVVIVEEPTYFLAFQMFRDHGLELRTVPLDAEGLVVEALIDEVAAIRAAGKRVAFVYTIPAFQNPTGITMSSQRRRDLVTAASADDVLIVADEVYHLLRYAPGPMPLPMSAYVDDAPILSIGTFSKILAPGMRLGWIHGSVERLAALADSGLILSGGGLNPVTSSLATAMIRMGWQQEYLEWLRATFARRAATMVAALIEHVPSWVEYDIPTGGYFVWLRLPPGTDGKALRAHANTHGVDVRHGAQFSPTGALGNHLRLSYAFYDDSEIAEGVARLGRALR
jgi:2-aminoadipate transaminase